MMCATDFRLLLINRESFYIGRTGMNVELFVVKQQECRISGGQKHYLYVW